MNCTLHFTSNFSRFTCFFFWKKKKQVEKIRKIGYNANVNGSFLFELLGGVMITRVCGLSTRGVIKDTRKNIRSIPFKNYSSAPDNCDYDINCKKQKTAVSTSTSVILGAVLLIAGCFLFSGLKKV